MTDEPANQYQIVLLNGLGFIVISPEPYADFLKTTLVNGYVMTQTDFAPYHAIAVILVVQGIPASGAADLRSLN